MLKNQMQQILKQAAAATASGSTSMPAAAEVAIKQ
jgi:hypothetical protein